MNADVVKELGSDLVDAIANTHRVVVREMTVIPKWIEHMDSVCTKLFGDKHPRDHFAKQMAAGEHNLDVINYMKWSITMGVLTDAKAGLDPLRMIDMKLTERLLANNEAILVDYRKGMEGSSSHSLISVVVSPENRITARNNLIDAVLAARECAHQRNGANSFFVVAATLNFVAAENTDKCPATLIELSSTISFKDSCFKYREALETILKPTGAK